MDESTANSPAELATEPTFAETTTAAASPVGRPADIPEKFWDTDANTVRVEALAQSYRELERHLGKSVKLPDNASDEAEVARFRKALGIPETPDDYALELGEDGFEADPAINARLHEAGFNQSQAQVVYDLARQYVGPLVQQAAADFEADRQTERLQQHFGGAEAWETISRQLQSWGKANLPAEALNALSTTYEGCLALHQMMQNHEPALARNNAPAERAHNEDLKAMMRDPRYWRDRDPAFIRQVTEGFGRLYSESAG